MAKPIINFDADSIRQAEMELSAKIGFWQGQLAALNYVLSADLDKKKIIAIKKWAKLQHNNLLKVLYGENE